MLEEQQKVCARERKRERRVNSRSQIKSSAFENVCFFERLSDGVCDAAHSLSPLSTGVLMGPETQLHL